MNEIYNYPKSSYECIQCDKNIEKLKMINTKELTDNTYVVDSNFSNFDYYSSHIFKTNKEPVINKKHERYILNPKVIGKDKLDKSFNVTNEYKECNNINCLTYDPRLYNAMTDTRLKLDTEPLNSSIKLNTLNTDETLNNYGKGYKSYSDINTGQIIYYIENDTENAFFEPVFDIKATAVGTLYKDPMSSVKPQWERFPEKYNPILGNQSDREFASSFIKDSQFQRDDLMALQMRKMNEQRYAPQFINNNI